MERVDLVKLQVLKILAMSVDPHVMMLAAVQPMFRLSPLLTILSSFTKSGVETFANVM